MSFLKCKQIGRFWSGLSVIQLIIILSKLTSLTWNRKFFLSSTDGIVSVKVVPLCMEFWSSHVDKCNHRNLTKCHLHVEDSVVDVLSLVEDICCQWLQYAAFWRVNLHSEVIGDRCPSQAVIRTQLHRRYNGKHQKDVGVLWRCRGCDFYSISLQNLLFAAACRSVTCDSPTCILPFQLDLELL